MTRITVCAKVSEDLAKLISGTGYRTSDVVRASLENFLKLPADDQAAILRELLIRKKCIRAMNLSNPKEF